MQLYARRMCAYREKNVVLEARETIWCRPKHVKVV